MGCSEVESDGSDFYNCTASSSHVCFDFNRRYVVAIFLEKQKSGIQRPDSYGEN